MSMINVFTWLTDWIYLKTKWWWCVCPEFFPYYFDSMGIEGGAYINGEGFLFFLNPKYHGEDVNRTCPSLFSPLSFTVEVNVKNIGSSSALSHKQATPPHPGPSFPIHPAASLQRKKNLFFIRDKRSSLHVLCSFLC